MTAKPAKLGEILRDQGHITPAQLRQALEIQQQCPAPLGRILIGEGFTRNLPIRDALAKQTDLPAVDLLATPPQTGLLRAEHKNIYIKLGAVPWRYHGETLILAITRLDKEVHRWATTHYGADISYVLTSPLDIQRVVAAHFAEEDSYDACFRLATCAPHRSALRVKHQGSRVVFWSVVVAAAVLFLIFPLTIALFTTLILQLFYLFTISFKCLVFGAGMLERRKPDAATLPMLADAALPIYTILVPLYKEGPILPGLLNALRQLDYPKSRLDVKLLVESDDHETWQILKGLKPESFFDIIRVPASEPRTKPKALNYGLRFALGSLIAVYDAEDQPEPLQLRKAATFFAGSTGRVLCVQARLDYYNREQNLLTRLFSLEYGAWFNYMLRGLSYLKMPLPLGGTSNHIPTDVLHAIHAWDPHNVTEDADLGLRLAIVGGRSALLDSVTMEEAPAQVKDWVQQRSRWIKGYIQTWLVQMRRPKSLWKHCGWRGFIGVQLFIGGPALVFALSPVLWMISAGWALGRIDMSYHALWPWVIYSSIANLILAVGLHLVQAVVVARDQEWKQMGLAIALFPFYWLLHSIASFRALWQLFRQPYRWDKTAHGHSLKGKAAHYS